MTERIDLLENPTWFLQPGDRIVETIVEQLLAHKVFSLIFGESIYGYKRMDIGIREMPALRVYNDTGRKEAETWYLGGDIKIDIIFPASIRREQTQKLPDLVASAMLSLFRAQPFFTLVRASVPGLNQLGWFFSFDKTLAFQPGENVDPCPVTQLVVNFRVNLEEFDRYLESDDRTPEQPFERTLADLETIYLAIQAKDDAGATQLTTTQNVTP